MSTWDDKFGIGEARDTELRAFLSSCAWDKAARAHLAGDASHRRYERLTRPDGKCAVLMDAPPDPLDTTLESHGKSYGDIAHLAHDCRPFAAIGNHLLALGFSAPELWAYDFERGFLLLENLGDGVFGSLIEAASDPAKEEAELYLAAVDCLVAFHQQNAPKQLPLPDGTQYVLPRYDAGALQIEVDLLPEWFVPVQLEDPLAAEELERFHGIWTEIIKQVGDASVQTALALRDYHSPNLLLLPQRQGVQGVGIIDFQDGLLSHPAYDLVSLLQDARRTVPAALEQRLLKHYTESSGVEPDAFLQAYASLGAQRNTKLFGIFCRLWKRDGKKSYLKHLPRVWEYMERNLAHPALADYKAWFDRNFPHENRTRAIQNGT